MTVSHLDHLKSDVAGWIAAAAEHRDVIEPKPGTRMVLGPLDSPNTREPPPLHLGTGPAALARGRKGGGLAVSLTVLASCCAPSCAEAARSEARAEQGRILHH